MLEGCGLTPIPYSLEQSLGSSALYSSITPASSPVQSMPIFWPGGSRPLCSGLSDPWCVPLLNRVSSQLLIHSLIDSFIYSLTQSPECQM